MSLLASLSLEYRVAEQELSAFKVWFSGKDLFKETPVHTELKKYNHLCLLIGFLGDGRKPDLFKHELQIGGVFRADYVVACSTTRHVTFVELECGEAHSIFGPKSTSQLRDWGAQIQRGYSQLADWTWAKNDLAGSTIFQNAIGFPDIKEKYVLICGRDCTLSDVERRRLDWRNEKTQVGGSSVLFMTYDDLVLHFEGRMDIWRDAIAEAAARSVTT